MARSRVAVKGEGHINLNPPDILVTQLLDFDGIGTVANAMHS